MNADPRPDPRPDFPEMRRRFGTPTPVDHLRESEKIIDHVHEWQSEEGITDATLVADAIDANRHATLALLAEIRANTAVLETIADRLQSHHFHGGAL